MDKTRRDVIDLIFINKKDFVEVKMKIYYQTMRVIIKARFKSLLLYMVI